LSKEKKVILVKDAKSPMEWTAKGAKLEVVDVKTKKKA